MKYNKGLKSTTTIEQSFRHILSRELKSINKWRKIAINAEDPEGVHQIHISLRKIRTALLIFKPVINSKFSQTLAKKLKQYATVLDDARDLDVYILTNFTDDSDSTLKSAAIAKRNKAYRLVKKLLKSKPFNKRIRSTKKWLKTEQWQKKIIKDKKLNHSLEAFASDTLDSLIKVIIVKIENPQQLNDQALHKLRIDCKKLRYTTEFFISLYDQNIISTFVEKLKQLQDSLGDIHDTFIQKQLHYKLLQNDQKIQLTSASQQVLIQIDRTAEIKKLQLIIQLTAFCHTEYPWRTSHVE
jgi:CHAD domain-containing protein